MFNYHGYSGPCPEPPMHRDNGAEELGKMDKVKFLLTEKQYDLLRPLFDLASSAYNDGMPGIVLAQIYEGEAQCFVEAGFLDNKGSLQIQRVTGVDSGKPCGTFHEVFTDIE